MESKDDPEARIRDLERPLTDRARSSELGTEPPGGDPYPPPTQPYATYPTQPYPADPYPPPPPMTGPLPPMPPPAGYGAPYPGRGRGPGTRAVWMLAIPALVVGAAAAIGIAVWFYSSVSDTRSMIDSFTETPQALPSIDIEIPPIVIPDISIPDTAQTPTGPIAKGDVASVSGVGAHRTLVCVGGDITVSGVDNVVELTGDCGKVTVSGVRNEVRIEAVGIIGVSGFENTVTYRDGSPQITQSGNGNSVDRG